MRTILAIAALLALTSGAEAYCYSVPDTAQTGYVENNLRRTICIQDELGQSMELQSRQTEVGAALSKMQRDMQQQKFQLQQTNALPLFGQPAFP
jgi:hypothetical protein